jgi:hypothetical protein
MNFLLAKHFEQKLNHSFRFSLHNFAQFAYASKQNNISQMHNSMKNILNPLTKKSRQIKVGKNSQN